MRHGTPLAVAALLATLFLAVGTSLVSAAGFTSGTKGPATYEVPSAGTTIAGNLGWISSNWAGYAVGGGPYRSVSGQWTVPRVSPSDDLGFSAQWVGVDGFANRSLLQAGTEADFYNGAAHYSAWWEVLPAPAVTIRTLRVRPGDLVMVTLTRLSATRWRIIVSDTRSGTYTTTLPYAGPGTSAEWIEEAPVVGGRATPLAVHPTVVFDNATVNGRNPHLSVGDGGAMVRRGGLAETPSAPDSEGNGFALAEQSTPPAPPPS